MEESRNWESFFKILIRDATVKVDLVKISLGYLNKIVVRKEIFDDLKRYFTICTIKDPDTGEIRVVYPWGEKIGNYCGERKYQTTKTVGKTILTCYRKFTLGGNLNYQAEFLESLKNRPPVEYSKTGENTLEKLITSSHKLKEITSKGALNGPINDGIQRLLKKTVDCFLRPVVLPVYLELKQDNLLNYRNDEDYLLFVLQEIKENGVEGTFDFDNLKDENGLPDTRKYYDIIL